MYANDSLHDDVLLDRLVDGELSGDERRRLLASLDERPEGWRRCALAFLEAQAWREELGQVARPSQTIGENAMQPSRSAAASRRPEWKRGVQWFAIAATVLIAFGLGWLQHGRNLQVVQAPAEANAQIAKSDPAPSGDLPKPVKADDALTMYVRDDSGRMQAVRVPLVDASTLDREFGVKFQPGVSDAMRNQLENRGFQVQSKQRYAPLWLENGRPMIVPVEDTKIVPVSDSVY